MLNPTFPGKQGGVVLMITLIVLVAMSLAGLALTRTVDTSNLIAGNLAAQQSAIQAGDTGIEAAVDWLESKSLAPVVLQTNSSADGYSASWQPPLAAGQDWAAYWTDVLSVIAVVLPQDASGNTVSYAIQRLCTMTGPPSVAGCMTPPNSSADNGNSQVSQSPQFDVNTAQYYRVTVQIVGPRNTVGYVQAIIQMTVSS
ncbi:hypothetical protein SAMN02949497_2765 [Methylomagnum ishizawai]|uniref:Type 4 fimbrial biogenesis protein PilX N-terminal domain-containing protein n=1 Tax=Methylomagnum ishizawai TaxID=1760988 RepID=A0A1Y6D4E2_9GAMM|nr:pilus assembly PilX N-terminal domain-containing protein [Methylomagnum ishizawai]SMF95402.1 hypothetical protein SAMN02949497_2765 [Methylomagnum ishizawai]